MGKVKLFKKADIILIAAAIIVSIALMIPHFLAMNNNDKIYAYVYVSGKEVQKIDLDNVKESYEIDLQCKPNITLEVEKGKICVKEAGCPDKLCVKCGWLSKNLDTAVCLPANVIVTVKSASNSGIDVITY